MTKRLTIAICTFDRINELRMCLNSIKEFMGEFSSRTDVLVVDNKGQVKVMDLVDSFKPYYDIAYIPCEKIGLSNARNLAALNAKADYVFYLDDDAKILANTLSEVYIMIEKYNFHIFGGSYKAYYLYEKPKWIATNFGSSSFSQQSIGITSHLLSGSVFVVARVVFEKVKFNKIYGMTGYSRGYGEETVFQKDASRLGFIVGFNPAFIVEHLVGIHKHSIIWHLSDYFYRGYYSDFSELSHFERISIFMKDIFFFIPAGILSGLRNFITKRNYYVQNLVLDSTASLIVSFGRFWSIIIPLKK